MCRGFQPINQRQRLKINAFYVHLSFAKAQKALLLPDSLTLHFLPRINGGPLEINGSSIRPDAPGFTTLHRVVSAEAVVYGSRERVIAGEGVRFEIYMADVKVLKGIFRKDEGENWKLECKCGLEEGDGGDVEFLEESDVCVSMDGHVGVVSEKVEMVRRRRKGGLPLLEEIPEERGEFESDGLYCCCCSECVGLMDGGDCEMTEVETQGARWAVDVGIWVVCLGVGYLVSKASCRRLAHKRLF